jgi:type I restriction enzyme S subunit
MSDEPPKGWASIALGDLFDFKYGKGLPQEKRNSKGLVKVYGSNGIVGVHNSAVTKGTTIIVGRKGSVGEIHLSNESCWPIDTTYFIDEFPAKLPPTYWALFLKSLRLGQQEKSSAIPGISRNDIYAVEVPLPPLAEQRRIVAKLEKLLGQVDASQQRLAKIPVLLKRFRQSVLAAACSGRLTADWRAEHDLDDEWPVEPLSDFFEMRNGKSLVATKRKSGDIPVYGGNGLMGTHNAANADGLVIVIGRVGAQCGNVHYVTGKVWVTDNAISLQGKEEIVPAFYAFFLRSLNLNTLSAGTGQPYVSQEILGPIETPVVSLAEQQEIVRRVKGLFALADQLEARLAKAQKKADKLTPSLLARAFAGKLVPQDPNDEPAEKMLERIRKVGPRIARMTWIKRGKDNP